ncbi:MAG: hypothetical protein ABI479_09190 [Gallionella sp.]
MEITCYRDTELQREPRYLPAAAYNTAHLLLEHSKEGVVFVPIRSMQYLAVIDHEEIIFLDSENKNWVEISWQNFRPQQRSALTEPVPYEAVYYKPEVKEIMIRLLGEFPPALKALAAKDTPSTPARIIKLDRSQPDN